MKRATIWQVRPDPWTEQQVESLARRENRSLSNMICTLCMRALETQRTQRQIDPETLRLAKVLAGEIPPRQRDDPTP